MPRIRKVRHHSLFVQEYVIQADFCSEIIIPAVNGTVGLLRSVLKHGWTMTFLFFHTML